MQHLDTVGEEAEDGAEPEEHCKAWEEALAELDPFWGGWRRGQLVQAVLGDPFFHLRAKLEVTKIGKIVRGEKNLVVSETVRNVGSEPLAKLVNTHLKNKLKIVKRFFLDALSFSILSFLINGKKNSLCARRSRAPVWARSNSSPSSLQNRIMQTALSQVSDYLSW